MSIYNEYSKLKEVILGISPKIFMQSELPPQMEAGLSWMEKLSNKIGYAIYKNKSIPKSISKKYENELEELNKALIANGVNVHRLESIEPMPKEPEGLIQMFARDPAMTIGKNFVFGNLQIPMRKKEYRGYSQLTSQIEANGLTIKRIDLNTDIFLEGGDVIVDYPYIFVGINTYATNLAGLKWLENALTNDFKVIPVFMNDPTIMHLNCCLTIIGPKLAVINKESLKQPLPYPLNEYQFIEVNSKVRKELGTNVLVIDPKTIIVQARHPDLKNKLKEKGFKVIPIDFTNHANTHGAFRCATCPINRE